MPVEWSNLPPPKPLRSDIGLIAIEAGETVLARLLGTCWWLSCHWVAPRSIVCLGIKDCRVHDYPTNKKGFISAQTYGRCWRGKRPGPHLSVLVITPEIGTEIADCPVGAIVKISRAPGQNNNPLTIELNIRQTEEVCPAGFDPRPFALRAMGFRGKEVAKLKLA